MRQYILLATLALATAAANAQRYFDDGFYRMKNVGTGRHVVMVDNKSAGINWATNEIDLGALKTYREWSDVECNPGSVFYGEYINADNYNLHGQGTDCYSIIGYYLRIDQRNTGYYRAFQAKQGMTIYLGDEPGDYEIGYVVQQSGAGMKNVDWLIEPVAADGNNYFGARAQLEAGGKHYGTMYASFAMHAENAAMKAMRVSRLCLGKYAVVETIEGDVAPGSPVIWESDKAEPADNRITPLWSQSQPVAGNILSGAYFFWRGGSRHTNQVAYDAATMRVLGVCADGNIGFVTATGSNEWLTVENDAKWGDTNRYIPANTAYLTVAEGTAAELPLITEQQAQEKEAEAAAVATVKATADCKGTEYNLGGQRAKKGSKGIVIRQGRKFAR